MSAGLKSFKNFTNIILQKYYNISKSTSYIYSKSSRVMPNIKFIYLPQSRSANMIRASAGTVLTQKINIHVIFKIELILDDLQNN